MEASLLTFARSLLQAGLTSVLLSASLNPGQQVSP